MKIGDRVEIIAPSSPWDKHSCTIMGFEGPYIRVRPDNLLGLRENSAAQTIHGEHKHFRLIEQGE